MFKINERYEEERSNFKYNYIGYTPQSSNNVDTPNVQILIDFAREDSVIFSRDIFIELTLN